MLSPVVVRIINLYNGYKYILEGKEINEDKSLLKIIPIIVFAIFSFCYYKENDRTRLLVEYYYYLVTFS